MYFKIFLELPRIVTWTDQIRAYMIGSSGDKWGSFNPSYLFCENSDLCFLLCYSKQYMIDRERLDKVLKHSFVNFNFWGIT